MLIGFYCLLFFLGAVFGSFGGVIIERGREGFARADWKRVFGGRSFCPSCTHQLRWWQLIPFVGRLLQKGKCFDCKKQIPFWYMREELLMGLVFVVTGWLTIGSNLGLLAEHNESLRLLFWLVVNWGLVLMLIADILWYELNIYVWILVMMIVAGMQVFGLIGDRKTMILGGIILSCVFYGIYLGAAWWQTRKMGVFSEGFGLGDVWMAGLVGSLAGAAVQGGDWIVWTQFVLIYLMLSSLLGIVFWLIRKGITGSEDAVMPFLPAMIVAFWFIVLFQKPLLGVMSMG